MIKHFMMALVLNVCMQPSFAMDNNQNDDHLSPSMPSREGYFQEKLLSLNVIWPEFQTTLGPNLTFEDLFNTHQLLQVSPHENKKKYALENAWRGDQVALREVIEQRWYKPSRLFELTDLIVRMAQLNSPVALQMLQNYHELFKSHELWRSLDTIVDKVNQKDPTAIRVLNALICNSPLETYAFPEHSHTIQEFLIDQTQNTDHPNFNLQDKLLEAYANGYYGIKKVYTRNKRFAREQMFHFALEHNNPKAQLFLLRAYREGLFGINPRSRIRLKEARHYLQQFSETDDVDLRNLVEKACIEGWYDDKVRPKKAPKTAKPINHVNQKLTQELVEYLVQDIEKQKLPIDTLEERMKWIESNGLNRTHGLKKNRKFALNALKYLAEEVQFFPAQTYLLQVYKQGLFGIKKRNRTRQNEALKYMKTFAYQGNHDVQMEYLYALREGRFGIDSTDPLVMKKALNLATQYAHHDNVRAQEFLINAYDQGQLGTKSRSDRHVISSKLKETFDYYPNCYGKKHNTHNIFLALSNETDGETSESDG